MTDEQKSDREQLLENRVKFLKKEIKHRDGTITALKRDMGTLMHKLHTTERNIPEFIKARDNKIALLEEENRKLRQRLADLVLTFRV